MMSLERKATETKENKREKKKDAMCLAVVRRGASRM